MESFWTQWLDHRGAATGLEVSKWDSITFRQCVKKPLSEMIDGIWKAKKKELSLMQIAKNKKMFQNEAYI